MRPGDRHLRRPIPPTLAVRHIDPTLAHARRRLKDAASLVTAVLRIDNYCGGGAALAVARLEFEDAEQAYVAAWSAARAEATVGHGGAP